MSTLSRERTLVRLEREGDFARVTMDIAERRNALSIEHMRQLLAAVREVGASDARGLLLAGEGPVFCAGHDFADMVDADLAEMRALLALCTELMTALQSIPQPVLARVHGLATAAGCQLVATADLAVASEDAGFAIPGGKGGWFCHTPLVAVARALPRKRALEMAFTGDVIDARTAASWGLVNAVVPAAELDEACLDLLRRATRGSRQAKGIGKQGFYAQVDLDQPKAYAYAMELMAATSQTPPAREGMSAFLDKRPARFD
jgi:enoyl-CoA hydratase/carnithine racemase